MRAIDADALKDDLATALATVTPYIVDDDPVMKAYVMGLNRAKFGIDNAPTIEPRKKGKWIKKTIKKKIENDYSCSECGRHVSVMRGYDVRLVYPFCHCGADMTEGEG